MGYTTNFYGSFTITPPLSPEQVAYINLFNKTRRMKRDAEKATLMPDPTRLAVGLPIGMDAAYFTGGTEAFGQGHDASVLGYNGSPHDQPGLWCQWCASDDGAKLMWDEGEKFYDYVEWLEYLIEHFFTAWGRVISGQVEYQGEDRGDRGTIWVKNNEVRPVVDVVSSINPFGEDPDDEA